MNKSKGLVISQYLYFALAFIWGTFIIQLATSLTSIESEIVKIIIEAALIAIILIFCIKGKYLLGLNSILCYLFIIFTICCYVYTMALHGIGLDKLKNTTIFFYIIPYYFISYALLRSDEVAISRFVKAYIVYCVLISVCNTASWIFVNLFDVTPFFIHYTSDSQARIYSCNLLSCYEEKLRMIFYYAEPSDYVFQVLPSLYFVNITKYPKILFILITCGLFVTFSSSLIFCLPIGLGVAFMIMIMQRSGGSNYEKYLYLKSVVKNSLAASIIIALFLVFVYLKITDEIIYYTNRLVTDTGDLRVSRFETVRNLINIILQNPGGFIRTRELYGVDPINRTWEMVIQFGWVYGIAFIMLFVSLLCVSVFAAVRSLSIVYTVCAIGSIIMMIGVFARESFLFSPIMLIFLAATHVGLLKNKKLNIINISKLDKNII
jgi:hypothetical protein